MRRSTGGRWGVSALAAVVFAGGCHRTEPRQEPAVTRPESTPSAVVSSGMALAAESAVATAEPAPSESPPREALATWTDPRVLRALASDCAYVPPDPEESSGDVPENLFACQLGYEQTCDPTPCISEPGECEEGCQKNCASCGQACVAGCEACKKPCTDEACRERCAGRCGTCREGCSRKLQKCSSAICGAKHAREEKACLSKLKVAWKAGGCQERCQNYVDCSAACQKKPHEGCDRGCSDALTAELDTCVDECAKSKDSQKCTWNCTRPVCSDSECQRFGPNGPA